MKTTFAICLTIGLVVAVFGGPAAKKLKATKNIGIPIGACTEPGEYLADNLDCQKFYECDEDLIPQPYLCDPDLCWYQAVEECVWANQGHCTTIC